MTMLSGQETDWGDTRNRVLAVALTILEDETCQGCGVPVWLGHSSNKEVVFDVRETTCWSCAEVEKDKEARKKAKPGTHQYAVPRNVWDDGVLPSRYDEYMRGLD